MCLLMADLSKDPSTQVGAVIVAPDHLQISSGFNGFPRNIKDDERLYDRDTKLKLVVHAEMNAVLAAAKLGIKVENCTMYLCAKNNNGEIWGGPPCTRCTVEILQSGITEIVTVSKKKVPSRWREDLELSHSILQEAGIKYREIEI